jgi:hypothetical protein
MIKKNLFYLIILIHPICYGQNLLKLIPNSIGINAFSQRTQTIMHSDFNRPYYSVYGNNKGIGFDLNYIFKKKITLNLFYNYTQLINTLDITKKNSLFFSDDIKAYKPLNFYWKSNEFGVGIKHQIYNSNGYKIFQIHSICTNYGQLFNNNLPLSLTDSLTQNIVFQDGIKAKLSYQIYHLSVKNLGLNILNGVSIDKKINSDWNLNFKFLINYGFIPLVATKMTYVITSDQNGDVKGDHNALSNNTGLRINLGLNYSLTKNGK